ncbi:MAG TPA: sugar ABC transporter permease [Firmicutes bacterium]|nr:sugar ABC transporter permease [Bacillota bacterium]
MAAQGAQPVAPLTSSQPRGGGRRLGGFIGKYGFILPTVGVILALSIYPLIYSLTLAFCSWQLTRIGGGRTFVGLANFIALMSDGRFWFSLKTTLIFVVVSVGVQYVIGLVMALILASEIRGRKFLRVLLLIPMMLTPVAIGYMWRMILNSTRGPANHFLTLVGLKPLEWLTSSDIALPSIILVDIWQWTPFFIVTLLAGIQSLPQDPYEAATIDGATGWQLFWYVTFPMLLPVSVTVIFLRAIEAFKVFDKIFVLTGGGPGMATESSTFYIYTLAFRHFNLGYASAAAYILLILIVFASTVLLNRIRRQMDVT